MRNLEGTFVELRSIQVDDAAITFMWRQSARASYLGGSADSIEKQAEWIDSRPKDEINFIIINKKNRKSVGMISLIDLDFKNMNAQTARFLIGDIENSNGFPIAAEAMLLLYDYAFGELDLSRVYGFINSENKLMIKWQKYMGMQHEGTWRKHLIASDGLRNDAELFGLLKVEFETVTKRKLEAMIKVHPGGK
jgi:RimJ/RimL family protein N-acetyltransferase